MNTISRELAPEKGEVEAAILVGLRAFNEKHVGPPHTQSIAIFVRDADGVAVGGLEGQLRWGWLYVGHLWLPEHLRGRGLGSTLVREAEKLAVEHGCTGAYLETFEFQALPFYEKLGYATCGVLEGFPVGSRRYSLNKRL